MCQPHFASLNPGRRDVGKSNRKDGAAQNRSFRWCEVAHLEAFVPASLPRVAVEQLHPTLARPNLARQTWTLPVSTLLRSQVAVDAF